MRANRGFWICAVYIACVSLTAQDWPQWRGLNRDGSAPFSEPKTWPEKLTAKWKMAGALGYYLMIKV